METVAVLVLSVGVSFLANVIYEFLGRYFKRKGQKIEIQFHDGKQKRVIVIAEGTPDADVLKEIKSITTSIDDGSADRTTKP